MNILSLTRGEVVAFVKSGMMRPENIRHYDICKAIEEGKTNEKVAEDFGLSDDSHVRYIKSRKCPDCGRTRG